MASPVSAQQLKLPTLTDPDGVTEVFCNDVVVQIRNGGVQLVFNSIQADSSDKDGQHTDRRIVRARVGMPAEVANAMLGVFQQLGVAMQRHQVLHQATKSSKPN